MLDVALFRSPDFVAATFAALAAGAGGALADEFCADPDRTGFAGQPNHRGSNTSGVVGAERDDRAGRAVAACGDPPARSDGRRPSPDL